ncbi:MAG: hypothetical protein LDLANPLL_02429 [Turneriella sp.]|nr:hypothetical protein [Turneriella sp.]
MRTTIDLPVDIYRKAKAEAALRGVKFRDMVVAGLTRELNRADSALSQAGSVRIDEFMESLSELSGQVKGGSNSLLENLLDHRASTHWGAPIEGKETNG